MARDSECLSEIVSRRKFGMASGTAGVAALARRSSEAFEGQRVGEHITGEFG